jgi:cellulose synthase operon protein C
MRVTCPSCQATYNLDERRIPPGGAKLKCTKCQNVFPIQGGQEAPGAVPLPGGGATPPPPLPPRKPADTAVPLPGQGSRATAVPPVSMTTGVIPLPSLGLSPNEAAVPRLTQHSPESALDEGISMTTGVIPLPSMPPPPEAAAAPRASTQKQPEGRTTVFPTPAGVAGPPTLSSVPLPQPAARAAPPPAQYVPPPLAPKPEPLPPPVEEAVDFPRLDEDFAAPPLPPVPAAPAADEGFADAWGAQPEKAPATSPSFGEVELEGGNANATDFPFPDDFEPAQPGGFAWDAPAFPPPSATPPAPTAPPSPKASARPAAPAVDPLEFDPSAPPQEDLEADLNAPLPRGPVKEPEPEDGLEMLGFLEDAAKETKGQRAKPSRYHVRRRSGKIIGPFDEGVIGKMLGDGQLLGNEDVSTDQETWTPLGSVPGFAQVMQKLLARTDAPPPTGPAGGPPTVSEHNPQDLDRLRQVYEGRMAVVSSMVDSDAEHSRRMLLLRYGAIGLGVVLVLGAGASLGFGRYGAFGVKWFFPPSIHAGTPEAARFLEAKASLAQDGYAALKSARAKLEALLAGREVPEVRAAWVQAVTRLERQYASTVTGDAARVAASLDGSVSLLGKHDVERVKAQASASLTARQTDQALLELAQAKASDTDIVLFRAEAALQKGQAKSAVELLDALSRTTGSARVYHALGMARLAAGDAAGADAAFAKALALDSKHYSSAVERAALAISQKNDGAAALTLLAPVLEPQALAALAPAEQSRALTLEGLAYLAEGDADKGLEVLERAAKAEGPSSAVARGALARAYLAKHDLDKALPLLSDAVKKEPQNVPLAEALVSALLAVGRPGEAQTAVDAALLKNPNSPRLLLLSGRVNESLDRLAEAEVRYKAALAADPDNPEPALALGRFFLRFRRLGDARAQFDGLAKRLPDDPRVLVGLGDLAMAEGDVPKARTDYEKATELEPKYAMAWLGQSRVAVEQQRWADARTDADKALHLDANVPDGRLQRGIALWKLKDYAAALTDMEAARTSSGNLKVNIAVGAVQLDQGNLPAAETALNQALKVEPSNPEGNFYMAKVHAARQEWTSAIESMRAALDRVPTRASYHYEMGRIYKDATKVPEAIEEWKLAVKLNPKYADAWAAIGEAEQQGQRCDDAIPAYESALAADPSRTALQMAVGDCLGQTNHWTDALARYNNALRVNPSLPGLYYKVARAYAELGDEAKAIPFYVKATAADPGNALAYYHLGYAYKEKGRKREAVAAFKAFLKASPTAKEKQEVEDEILDLQGGR